MQLLNSNISQGARTTRYGNKKAQDLQNLVLFCYVAFSYYKDGFLIRNNYTSISIKTNQLQLIRCVSTTVFI